MENTTRNEKFQGIWELMDGYRSAYRHMEDNWDRIAKEFQREHPEICKAMMQPGVHELLQQGLTLAQIAERQTHS